MRSKKPEKLCTRVFMTVEGELVHCTLKKGHAGRHLNLERWVQW